MPTGTTGDRYVVGGGNRVDAFEVTESAGAYTVSSTLEFTFNLIEDGDFKATEDGTLDGTLTQLEDTPELEAFYYKFAREVNGSSAKDIAKKNLENGNPIGGGSASGKKLLFVIHGAKQRGNDNYKMTVAYGSIPKTVGSWKTKDGESTDPSMEFTGAINSLGEISIPAECFKANVTPAIKVIPKGQGWMNFFMPKAVA